MAIVQALKRSITRRRPLNRDSAEVARAAELAGAIAGLPDLDGPPPQSAAAAEWIENRRRLRQLLAGGDPRRFLEWDVIHKTMFLGSAPHVREELNTLKQSKDWRLRWRQALIEDAAGCPPRFRWRLSSSGGLIHHAFQIYSTEPLLGRQINQFSRIIEFGGGYGGFSRLVWRLGFRGRHVIFDLPEFSALQRYFLQSVGVPLATSAQGNGVRCISDMAELAAEAGPGEGLFIGYWSISETPLDFRRQILGMIGGLNHFCIAYQDQFAEADNVRFFTDWSKAQNGIKWTQTPVPHLPGSWYLVGARQCE